MVALWLNGICATRFRGSQSLEASEEVSFLISNILANRVIAILIKVARWHALQSPTSPQEECIISTELERFYSGILCVSRGQGCNS